MNKKIFINISSLLMIYALLVTPLIYTHTCTLYNTVLLFIYIFCFYFIGASLLVSANVSNLLLPLSNAGMSIFIGALVFSIMIFISVNNLFLTILLLIITFSLLIFFRKNTDWSLKQSVPGVFAFLITLLIFILISPVDLSEQFSAGLPNRVTPDIIDSYYFTSIVASIRHGSIYNASYEINTPINYQLLGFFIPAMLADALKISSHQALWGLAQPFYKFLAILLSYELCYFFLKEKVLRTNYWFILFSLSLPILLMPLNLLSVIKGNIKDFMLICMAYFIPNGVIDNMGNDPYVGNALWYVPVITRPIAIILVLFCLLLFSKIDWQNKKISADKILFTICMSIMILAKTTIYYSFIIFITTIVFKRILFDKEKLVNYIVYGLGSVLISFILLKTCINQPKSSTIASYFKFDHFYFTFMDQPLVGGYQRSAGFLRNIIIICLILFSYMAWGSIRLLGLIALLKSKVSKLNEYLLGGIISLLGTTFLASFLHFRIVYSNGNFFDDFVANIEVNMNVQQFIASSFYILTIISVIGILHLFYYYKLNKISKNIIMLIIGIWCSISLISLTYIFITIFIIQNKVLQQYSWYSENVNAVKTGKYNDGLIVVNPDSHPYGIMLASSDYGTYWTAMGRTLYYFNSSNKNDYRWFLFKDLLDKPEEKYFTKMESEGVKYIISTPDDSIKMVNISILFPQYIHKIKETKWIYALDMPIK